MRHLLIIGLICLWSVNAGAELHTENVEYRHGDTVLVGYLAYDNAIKGKRPGVLVVHEWWGNNSYSKRRAEQLARLGYVALALDMYGQGIVAKDAKEAGALAGAYRNDRRLMRERASAGLEVLRTHELTDTKRMAAIGYCFGGTAILELARSGTPLAGFVSFHGGLDTPDPRDAENIKGKVLVLHGGDDPNVPTELMAAFQDEMRKAGVDWQVFIYGGAVHSFSNPESGNDKSRGVAYDEKADKRSWEAMKMFFAEIFK